LKKRLLTSRHIEFEDSSLFTALCGPEDANLRAIEETLGVQLATRGTTVHVEGEEFAVDLVESALRQFYKVVKRGFPLYASDTVRGIEMLSRDGNARLDKVFLNTIAIPTKGREIAPRSLRQKLYIEAIREKDIVFGIGPAGTGKTYLAMAMAVSALQAREVERIILARPAVEAGEKLGFLPGDMMEKVDPYLRPLHDALHDMMDVDRAYRLMADGTIEVAPLAFMRGRTLNNAFVILDEAQNTTRQQMKMFLTRLGVDSKAVITGDVTQIDLPSASQSGLVHARRILQGVRGIGSVLFESEDVVRHALVRRIVDAYDQDSTGPRSSGSSARAVDASDASDVSDPPGD
jgi:phosphate starvation-inducible PhoH-like protein